MYAFKVTGSEFETVLPTGTGYPVEQLNGGIVGGVTGGVTGGIVGGVTGGIRSTGLTGQQQQPSQTGVEGLWEQPEIVRGLAHLPRVLPFYAKTREGLEQIMEHVEQNPSDLSIHCLLNAHSTTTYTPKVYPYRGFTLVNGEQKMRQIEQVEQLEERPVWFLFSGMGIEQWQCGMTREMMKLDSFRRSILRSCQVLRPYGINLLRLIIGGEQEGNNVVMTGIESFVYLTSVQIALVDCLRQIGVRPEGLIGQSIGELVCAYVEQCLTHEQTLMTSYYLAKCIQQAQQLPKSMMAIVGDLTWEQLRNKCPQGVVPVCFDSLDQFLITGPHQQVKDLLRQLRLEGFYVREIELPTTTTTTTTTTMTTTPTVGCVENFSYIHTQYMNEFVPVLRQHLECLNIVPKQRSSRWISTSVPEQKWSTPMGQMFNIEYLLNLLTSPVMLHQTMRQVPRNAILIEISPRSLVQTLLKKSLFQQYQQQEFILPTTLPITFSLTPLLTSEVTAEGYLECFLIQLGKMYIEGLKFDSVRLFVPCVFESIYPIPVEQTLVDTFSSFGMTLEPSLYFIKKQINEFSYENSNENPTEVKTSIKFFPYSEFQKPCQQNSYVMVDQNENELVFNSIQPTVDSISLINEFYDYYLTECSRYINYIISKIENQTQTTTIQPCPLPLALQEQLENLTIYFQTIRKQTPVQLRLAELLEGGKLLQYLKDLSSISSSDLFESMKNFNLIIQEDLVLSQISRISVFLKNSFDLIMENLNLNDAPLRILEISTNSSEFSGDKCMAILSNQIDLNKEIKYEYVPLNYSFEIAKTCLNNYQVMDWNLKISSNGKFESNIPSECNGQYDLIYLNGCLSTTMSQSSETEIKYFIQNTIEKLLKPSGFVFFSEYTSNFEFVEGLCKLEHLIQAKQVQNTKLNQQIKQLENFKKQSPFETQCKIEQQIKQLEKLLVNIGGEKFDFKLQDHFKWKQFLDGLNFYPIGLKNDSRLKSLFVYRKPVGHLNEARIVIDEFLTNEKETLGLFEKISLVLNDDKIERLWLISEKHLSPLSVQTAFVNVLEGLRHQENGHKIRCLFLNDDEKIIFDLKELDKWTDVLDKVRKADLFMNVFQSGQWGCFRLVDIPCEIRTNFEMEEKKIEELFKSDETYILVDGLDNEFGLELTQWLVESGVKYIILTTKTSNVCEFMNTELFKKLNDLQDIYGAEIRISSVLDLNDENECLGLVKQACKISPENKIGGLFHLGGLYDKDFTQSLFNLDKFTRCASIMSEKGYFVVFKTALENLADRVCELRQREGDRHALVIDLEVLKGEKCFETLENMLLNNPTKKFESKIEKKMEKRQVNLMPKRVIEKLNSVEMTNMVNPIFVVHPIEGHVNMLRTWAEKFQVPVYGLQYTQECLRFETIEQLAQFYWQQIEIAFPHLNNFHLVGHTFGVPVAFEMALRRPQQVISLALLDSGLTQTFLNVRESTVVGENEALYRFYQQFVAPSVRMPVGQFYQVLSTQMTTFDQRVKYVVDNIVEQSQFGFDLVDLEQAVRSYVIKTNMSCKYIPAKSMPLEKILVVRPTLINGKEQTYQNILNLYQYFGGEIDMRFVFATEKTFLEAENALTIARFVKQHNEF